MVNRVLRLTAAMAVLTLLAAPAAAQSAEEERRLANGPQVATVQFVPERLQVAAGEAVPFPEVRLLNAQGNTV